MMTAGDRTRAGIDGAEADKPPLYARMLRLKHIRPGPWWCFLFLEGSLAFAGVLVLADWISPWGLLVLPLGVAIAVKLNDAVTGALPPSGPAKATRARSTSTTDSTSGSTTATTTQASDEQPASPDEDGTSGPADPAHDAVPSEAEDLARDTVAGDTRGKRGAGEGQPTAPVDDELKREAG